MAARSENLVIIIGNLTRDPELRYTPQGSAVVGFGVATNREWTTADGAKKEDTQFHEIVAWNRLAEICNDFLSKGAKVYVKGRLRTRTWDDASGVRHYRTEIVVEDMVLLGGGRSKRVQESSATGEVVAGGSSGVEVNVEVAAAPAKDLAESVNPEDVEDMPF